MNLLEISPTVWVYVAIIGAFLWGIWGQSDDITF
jgi:hypothetical protein